MKLKFKKMVYAILVSTLVLNPLTHVYGISAAEQTDEMQQDGEEFNANHTEQELDLEVTQIEIEAPTKGLEIEVEKEAPDPEIVESETDDQETTLNTDATQDEEEQNKPSDSDSALLAKRQSVTVSSYNELLTEIDNAPTTGEEVVIQITEDIRISGSTTLNIAAGKNIVLQSTDDVRTIYSNSVRHISVQAEGILTLRNIILDGEGSAGGLEVRGHATLESGTVIRRNNYSNGGAAYVNTGTLVIEDALIEENQSTNSGGIYVPTGTLIMNGGVIQNNSATIGGGVYVNGGTFTMNGGVIRNNRATSNGGGINLSNGTFTMNGGGIRGNSAAAHGGGIYHNGTFVMNNGEFRGNTAETNGGGIYIASNRTFEMYDGLITQNSSNNEGGGIHVAGTTVTIHHATISQNSTNTRGGGISLTSSAVFTMHSGSIVENATTNPSSGGGGGIGVSHAGARNRIVTGDTVRFAHNRAAIGIRISPAGDPSYVKFATVSVSTIAVNNYDIESGNGDFITTYQVTLNIVDEDGDEIVDHPERTFVVMPGSSFNVHNNLNPVTSYIPMYYTLAGDSTPRDLDELLNINSNQSITVHYRYTGDEDTSEIHTVTIHHVDLDGQTLAESTQLSVLDQTELDLNDHLAVLDTYKAQHFAIGEQTYTLDETPLIEANTDITITYTSTIINVTVPSSIDFWATAQTNGEIVSTQSQLQNLSDFSVNIHFISLEPKDLNGLNLVANATQANEFHLNLETDFGTEILNIEPQHIYHAQLGTIDRDEMGTLQFGGRYVGRLPREALRPAAELILSIEAIY